MHVIGKNILAIDGKIQIINQTNQVINRKKMQIIDQKMLTTKQKHANHWPKNMHVIDKKCKLSTWKKCKLSIEKCKTKKCISLAKKLLALDQRNANHRTRSAIYRLKMYFIDQNKNACYRKKMQAIDRKIQAIEKI